MHFVKIAVRGDDWAVRNENRLRAYGYGDSPTTVKVNWTGTCKKVERKTAF